LFFSVYSNILNCNFPSKSFGYKADSLASCVHACKQLAHKTAYRLCFTRLILTLKNKCSECTKMHHCQTKDQKKFWGGGTAPFPNPSPTREGDTSSPDPIHLGTFDALIWCSAFLLFFIYDWNTGGRFLLGHFV